MIGFSGARAGGRAAPSSGRAMVLS